MEKLRATAIGVLCTHPQTRRTLAKKAMTVPVEASMEGKTTQGLINFTSGELTDGGTVPYFKITSNEDGSRSRESNMTLESKQIVFHDIRTANKSFSLQKEGFVQRPLRVPKTLDWQDDEQVKKVYYPAVEKVLKEATGATRVLVFDHTRRNGHASIEDGQKQNGSLSNAAGLLDPVTVAHVDYSARSGPSRLSELLPDEAEKLRKTPYAIIQAWKPIKGPVLSSPLAIADASTVLDGDLRENEIRFPNRTGHTSHLIYNPEHRWYYTEHQAEDEAYLFVCYDSRSDRARFTPHTGFVDFASPPNAPRRESIEIRSYVFWENEQPHEPEQKA